MGKRIILNGLVALLLLFSLSAMAAECPIPSAVRYDQSRSRFMATDATGLTWRSAVMSVSTPSPTLTAEAPLASGTVTAARVWCRYDYNGSHGLVVLSPESAGIAFALTDPSAWKTLVTLFICKTTDCQFTRI